jgi:hypothetical protein
LVTTTACNTSLRFLDEPDANGSPDASPACVEAVGHSDFAYVRDKVFAKSCKFEASCHGSTGKAAKLSLTPANAYKELVNVPSIKKPEWILVTPGMPEKSYLLVKIGAVDGPLVGDRMPYRNRPMCKEKRDAVMRWVAEGALAGDDVPVPDAAPPTPRDGGLDAKAPATVPDAPPDDDDDDGGPAKAIDGGIDGGL